MENRSRTIKLIKLCVCLTITCMYFLFSCFPHNKETRENSAEKERIGVEIVNQEEVKR